MLQTRKKNQITILSFWLVCFIMVPYLMNAQSVKEIMIKCDSVFRKSYLTFCERTQMSSFKYIIENGSMKNIEKPRIVVIDGVTKFFGKDYKSIAVVLEPPSEKDICLLYYEYYDSHKDNDNWMYLPALGKVKRVISSTSDNDDSGNFLGTEFCTEDMEARRVDDYTYKLLGEEIFENRPTWKIEIIPTPARLSKTKYSKAVAWIDKERYVSLRDDLYNHKGILCKQHIYKKYYLIDNTIWAAPN
jgi:hypothetical protein